MLPKQIRRSSGRIMIERIGPHVGLDRADHGVSMSDCHGKQFRIAFGQGRGEVLQGENSCVRLNDECVEGRQNGGRELGFVHVSDPLSAVMTRLMGCVAPEGAEEMLSNADFLGLVDFHEASARGARVSTPACASTTTPAGGRKAAGAAA